MQRLRVMILCTLAGCAGGGAGESGDSADTAPEADPNAPVVQSAQVSCYLHETGETYVQWSAGATATDKQGLSTIETLGRIEVSDAGGAIGTQLLVCAEGACTGSWRDGDMDIECDNVAVTTYDFAFIVVDIDGHESAPLVVHGEKTTEG